MPERDAPPTLTVAAYDIARFADVGRAAVSNWRRRYPDFPQPVGGTSASPLYALDEVESWLHRHGRPFHVGAGDRVWPRLRASVEELRLDEALAFLGAFLLFLRRKPKRWTTLAKRTDDALTAALPAELKTAVPEVPPRTGAPPVDAALIRAVATAAGAGGHRDLFESLCLRYYEVHARRRPETPAVVIDLMLELIGPADGMLLDPACGMGTRLRAAQESGWRGVWGQDSDASAAGIAAARLALSDASLVVEVGDALRGDAFGDRLADAVLCDPPFNERSWGYEQLTGDARWVHGLPPRGEPELAWVQHCLARVRPGGLVAILLPGAVAGRRAGRRIRGNLLRAGVLCAVVGLPAAGTSGAPDLWLLRRPEDAAEPTPNRVLFAVPGADLSTVVDAWRAFRADPTVDPPGPARSVRIIDLLDEEVDLTPGRRLGTEPAPAGEYGPARDALLAGIDAAARAVPALRPATATATPMTTVGELIRAGSVTVAQAPLRTGEPGTTPVLTLADLLTGAAPSGTAGAVPGSVLVAPGDVVVPSPAREAVVRVVDTGGALLGAQLALFRPDPDRLDPHFLAGILRVALRAAAGRGGSLASRADLRRAAVPRLPIDAQRRQGEAYRRLFEAQTALRRLAADAEKLMWLGLTGLAEGGLDVPAEQR